MSFTDPQSFLPALDRPHLFLSMSPQGQIFLCPPIRDWQGLGAPCVFSKEDCPKPCGDRCTLRWARDGAQCTCSEHSSHGSLNTTIPLGIESPGLTPIPPKFRLLPSPQGQSLCPIMTLFSLASAEAPQLNPCSASMTTQRAGWHLTKPRGPRALKKLINQVKSGHQQASVA
jgi:hypothetical protein